MLAQANYRRNSKKIMASFQGKLELFPQIFKRISNLVTSDALFSKINIFYFRGYYIKHE